MVEYNYRELFHFAIAFCKSIVKVPSYILLILLLM